MVVLIVELSWSGQSNKTSQIMAMAIRLVFVMALLLMFLGVKAKVNTLLPP